MRFLTVEEVGQLVDAIDGRYQALILLLAYGGLRIGEALALRRVDVDPLRAFVRVEQTASWVKGKLHLNPLKTKKGRRQVPIPRAVAEAVAAHLAGHDHDLVFPAPQGGHLEPNRFRSRYWNPALEASGLAVDEPLTPHDLRHTAVALWIAKGSDPKAVSTWAGHASVAFTLDRYGHLYPDHGKATMDALDEAIEAAKNGKGEEADSNVVHIRPGQGS